MPCSFTQNKEIFDVSKTKLFFHLFFPQMYNMIFSKNGYILITKQEINTTQTYKRCSVQSKQQGGIRASIATYGGSSLQETQWATFTSENCQT